MLEPSLHHDAPASISYGSKYREIIDVLRRIKLAALFVSTKFVTKFIRHMFPAETTQHICYAYNLIQVGEDCGVDVKNSSTSVWFANLATSAAV